MLGSPNQNRLLDADHRGVFEESLLIFRSVLLHRDAVARGVVDNFVVHVGDVHNVAHGVSTLPEEAAQQVDGNESAEVADMSVVVNGRPHAYMRTSRSRRARNSSIRDDMVLKRRRAI